MPNAVPLGGIRYLNGLAGYFNETVTILRYTATQNEYNEDVKTWTPLVGHTDLEAAIGGGDVGIRLKKQEFRTSQTVSEMQYRRIFLAGAYTQIDHKDRARFLDDDWAIVSIVVDQTSTITELLCESLEPGNI